MKFATFSPKSGSPRAGRVENDTVVDLGTDMMSLLAAPGGLSAAGGINGERHALAEVTLHAPLARPPKILAIGLNYRDHIEETGLDTPGFPMFFNKQSTAANGPYAPIHPSAPCFGQAGLRRGARLHHRPPVSARATGTGA